ncbi:MAG: hypothetical protein PHQ53_07710 [Candidatus Krumholzibacteria bacterium]|nr:hypothetical protein [Candidatus Krumholzibacteria bacterium]
MTVHPSRFLLLLLTLIALFCVFAPQPAYALLTIDFEQTYYVHPGMQVWDLSLIRHDGLYNIFYHGIPEATPGATNAKHIWRATSSDLIYWSEPTIVLSTSDDPHEALAVWAPAVVHDDETGLWWMAYTGVDAQVNQRICMAWSRDLQTWFKSRLNPVLEPDPAAFYYPATDGWAECRDPFLFREDGLWHMLVCARLYGISGGRGALARTTSPDLLHWSPLEVFAANMGEQPGGSLESPQYLVREGVHHLFFHEYATIGLSHLATVDPTQWDYAGRTYLDPGIAPEICTFDDGQSYLLTRIGAYQEPGAAVLSWVARTDTLQFNDGLAAPVVFKPHPLRRNFRLFSGAACLGNPCYGDNPARRGEPSAGLAGRFFFGSREYYQGPLSGRGDAGSMLGLSAQGYLVSYPFAIQGNSITLLVGGSSSPQTCYVALVDADTDTVLHKATGYGFETMSMRYWDVSDLQGREVYIRIQDSDHTSYINVDEIRERMEFVSAVADPAPVVPTLVADLGPRPNPFNPRTTLSFELATAAPCRVQIHDLRGRLIWDSRTFAGQPGTNSLVWRGINNAGEAAPAGVYVYRISLAGRPAASGKLTLIP